MFLFKMSAGIIHLLQEILKLKLAKSGIRVKEKESAVRGREVLLAVDLGLSTGIAIFDENGNLSRYRSHHLPDKSTYKRWIMALLREFPDLRFVIVEGGGELAEEWKKVAGKRGFHFKRIDAGIWRQVFLLPREQKSGNDSKENAIALAREIIRDAGIKITKTLRHDTAEAILTGCYGVELFSIRAKNFDC